MSRQALPPVPVADVTRIGPYFAFGSARVSAAAGWRPARELLEDAGGLGPMIDDVGARLGTAERWIAASIFYQGWAARLTAIYAGSACACGAVPDLRIALVSYRFPPAGLVELNVAPLHSLSPAAGWRAVRAGHLDPLGTAIRRQVRVGSHLLAGNVGSALAGALSMIAARRRQPIGSLLRCHWAHPADLAASGRWLRTPDGPRYARATCCGFELLDRGGRCGDCSLSWHGRCWPVLGWPVLAAPPDTRGADGARA
jgi:hypothetical protein